MLRNNKTSISYRLNILIFLLTLFAFQTVWAAPKADFWPRWVVTDPFSTLKIDYKDWQAFLNKYLVEDQKLKMNWVNYGAVTVEDRQRLNAFIQRLSQVNLRVYNRKEQLTYWINLYNALVVRLVLSNYPVKSIMDIDGGFQLFGRGPWKKKIVKVDNVPLSLDDIEHRIVRPIWRDARVHYALNCGSYSCPKLSKNAYSSKKLDQQLNQAAHDYINSPSGVRIVDNQAILSKIYEWYRVDFGGTVFDVLYHLKLYADKALKEALEKMSGIKGYEYDWQLNDTRLKPIMKNGKRIVAVLPALNEAKSVSIVVRSLLDITADNEKLIDEVVVCDNGSTDATSEIAEMVGATVFFEPKRGYGQACLSAVNKMDCADIVLFFERRLFGRCAQRADAH